MPTGDVTVNVNDPTDNTDVTAEPASLTFSTSTWNAAQNVTVTAAEDDDASADPVATVKHTVGGGGYDGVTVPDAVVTIRENDSPGLVLSETSVTVEEGSATGTSYTVRLSSEPTATVTVAIRGQNGTDLNLSGLSASSTLTFTISSWNAAQTITVTAREDADAVTDMATLTHEATGGDYGDVSAEVEVTVVDDETPSIVLNRTTLGPAEGTASGESYTVRLSHVPTETVTVRVSGHGGTDLTLSTTTLTFNSSNWNTAQTVTVTAAPDDDAVDDRVTLTHSAEGGAYDGLTRELTVSVDDDEERRVVLSETSLRPVEGDATGQTYTVRLSSQPTAATTVNITGHDGTDLALDRTTLTFNSSSWSTERTISVTAAQDADALDDEETLTHTARGGDYEGLSTDLEVRVEDDESPHLALSKSSLPLDEGAAGATYTVRLGSQPTATVTVTISGHAGTDLGLSGVSASSTLTFTTSSWNTPRTVTVTAADDADAADDGTTLTHTATGGDYGGVVRDLPVTVKDDETASLVLTPTKIEIDEAATGSASYTVRLSSEPTATTTVNITGHSGADLSLDRTSLTFTTSNWNTPQTVAVTATHDDDALDDTVTLTHEATGGDYGDAAPGTVLVTVTDDDEAGLALSKESISPQEGGATGRELHRQAGHPALSNSDRDHRRTLRHRPHPVHHHPHLHGIELEHPADGHRHGGRGHRRHGRHRDPDPHRIGRRVRERHEGADRRGRRHLGHDGELRLGHLLGN